MAIEISSFFGRITNKTYANTGLKSIFNSLIYTSILITVIIMISITFIYPCKRNTPNWVFFKLSVYIFIIVGSVLFIHKSILKSEYDIKYTDDSLSDMIGNMDNNAISHSQDMIKVQPKILLDNLPIKEKTNIDLEENTTVGGMIDQLETII